MGIEPPELRRARIGPVKWGLRALLLLAIALPLRAATWDVSPSGAIRSISEAIATAAPSDTIRVAAGTYTESDIIIDKPLTLVGENRPTIDGAGKGIFHIAADQVAISGFRLTNVQTSYTQELSAIHASKVQDFLIEDNQLDDIFFGILLEKSSRGKVLRNRIAGKAVNEYNSGNGVHLWHCSEIDVDENEVSGMRDGIYFEFVEHSRAHHNNSHQNVRYGLHFMFSNDNAYRDNVFTRNGAGVAVMFSKRIEMTRNRFTRNWGSAAYGLLLKEINDASITDNVFERNTIGINAEGSNRIDYQRNVFRNNGWAVKISGACYRNVFSLNSYLSNAFDVAYKGSINDNSFDSNYWSGYAGYDLDRDGVGDVPYRPVKLFSYIATATPESIVLLRSLFMDIIDFSEKVSPIFTPENLVDANPLMAEAQ